MSITNYILAFAELLEKGALLAKEDPTQNVGLKPEDHPMHVILANVLRKAVNSNVMASVADDFHAAFNAVSNEKNVLQAKINALLSPAPTPADANPAVDEAAPIEGEIVPRETSTE